MAFGSTKRESNVLKLVHPGGYVEVHMEPITAAQVMDKNPRHCVTRTDVFKFPWIVVRPDSVLSLGNVFFIVPNHTLYRLLQNFEARRQSSSLRTLPLPKQSSDIDSCPGMTPEHFLGLRPDFQFNEINLQQTSLVDSRALATPKHGDHGYVNQKTGDGSLAKETPKLEEHGRCLKQLSSKSQIKRTTKNQDNGGHSKQQSRWDCVKVIPELQNRDRSLCLQQLSVESCDEVNGKHGDQHPQPKRRSLIESSYVGTPKRQNHVRQHQKQSQVGCWGEVTPKKHKRQSIIETSNNETPTYQILPKQFPAKSRHELINQQRRDKQHKEQSSNDSFVGLISFQSKNQEVDTEKCDGLELHSGQDMGVLNLKSCLRQPGNNSRRSLGVKVSFVLTKEVHKED